MLTTTSDLLCGNSEVITLPFTPHGTFPNDKLLGLIKIEVVLYCPSIKDDLHVTLKTKIYLKRQKRKTILTLLALFIQNK